ncbi:hypothetical protein O9X98_08010 [Agrobacterium salinitolerans]|nr:hypothetical protein [Agrobacterium salinitolerans]
MRIEFRYPAVLTYQATSRQLPRHHVSTMLAQVEVQEISSQDAPEVISWTPEGSGRTVSFRLIKGKVCGLMNANLSHASCRTGEDYPTQPLVALALARLKSIVAEKGPSFVLGDFHDPAKWPCAGDNWHPQAHAEDVTEWENNFAACVADMAIVEGQLWRATREPLVVVYRNTAGWQTALTQEVSFGQDLHRFHFPVDRWEEAQEFCSAMAERAERPAFLGTFSTDAAWSAEREPNAGDLLALAARLERHISRGAANKAWKKGAFGAVKPNVMWHDLPSALFLAYGGIRNVLALPESSVGEREAAELVEHFEAIMSLSERSGLSWLALQPEAFRTHIEKWNSRPIELAFANDGYQPHGTGRHQRVDKGSGVMP